MRAVRILVVISLGLAPFAAIAAVVQAISPHCANSVEHRSIEPLGPPALAPPKTGPLLLPDALGDVPSGETRSEGDGRAGGNFATVEWNVTLRITPHPANITASSTVVVCQGTPTATPPPWTYRIFISCAGREAWWGYTCDEYRAVGGNLKCNATAPANRAYVDTKIIGGSPGNTATGTAYCSGTEAASCPALAAATPAGLATGSCAATGVQPNAGTPSCEVTLAKVGIGFMRPWSWWADCYFE